MGRLQPLTERDYEVLSCVAPLYSDEPIVWLSTMECGGRNGSYHNATLMKLAKRGLVMTKQRWSQGDGKTGDDVASRVGMSRGSRAWKPTEEGLAVLEASMVEKFGHGRLTRAQSDQRYDQRQAERKAKKEATLGRDV